MPRTLIYIDLEEVDTDDLVDELSTRDLEDIHYRALLGQNLYVNREKINLFNKVMHRFSLLELQEMFTEYFEPLPLAKNQLKLNL